MALREAQVLVGDGSRFGTELESHNGGWLRRSKRQKQGPISNLDEVFTPGVSHPAVSENTMADLQQDEANGICGEEEDDMPLGLALALAERKKLSSLQTSPGPALLSHDQAPPTSRNRLGAPGISDTSTSTPQHVDGGILAFTTEIVRRSQQR